MKSGDNYDTFENFANAQAAKNGSQAEKTSLNGIEAYSYESIEECDGVKYQTRTYILDAVDSFVALKYRLADADAAYEMERMLNTLAKENLESDFITPERMCEMAEKDYQKKNGNAEVSAEIGEKNADGTVDILLKDETGNTVDTYTVDTETGKGTNEAGKKVDFPQTGMSGAHKALAGIAALMALTGAALIKKGIREDE